DKMGVKEDPEGWDPEERGRSVLVRAGPPESDQGSETGSWHSVSSDSIFRDRSNRIDESDWVAGDTGSEYKTRSEKHIVRTQIYSRARGTRDRSSHLSYRDASGFNV